MEFKGHEILAETFPSAFVDELITSAEHVLQHRLLMLPSIPTIPLASIHDDTEMRKLNLKPGYSFTEHRRKSDRILPKETIRRVRDLSPELSSDQGAHHKKVVDDFLEIILLACICMGGPCRALNIASLRMANDDCGGVRSIIVLGGNVTLIRTDPNQKAISRPLDDGLGTLIVVYIIGVIPYLRP